MKNIIILRKLEDFVSTSFYGLLAISYQELVNTLGEPNSYPADKTDAEWLVKDNRGTVLSIYNYKDGKAYLGSQGDRVEDITVWHIGGESKDCIKLAKKVFGKSIVSNI